MRSVFLILFFLIFNLSESQNLENNFSLKYVNAAEGLSQLSVKNCLPDNNGFIWIATEMGLYKYDGIKVTLVKSEKYPEISKQRIFVMAKDYETDIIYFVTYPGLKSYSISKGIISQVLPDHLNGILTTKSSFFLKKVLKKSYNIIKKNSLFSKQSSLFYSSLAYNNSYTYYRDLNYIGCVDSQGKETIINYKTSEDALMLKFNDSIIITDYNKIAILEGPNILKKSISYDNIINQFLNTDLRTLSYSPILKGENSYFLNFNGKVYKILLKNNHLYTYFLFNSPSNDISNLHYSDKQDLYFLSTASKGMIIVKPAKINIIFTGNDYLDCNYAVIDKNGFWYSCNGWVYNRVANNMQIRINKNSNGNTLFLLPFENKLYYEGKNHKLISLENFTSEAPVKVSFTKQFTGYTYFKNNLWISSDSDIGYLSKNSIVIDSYVNKIFEPDRKINTLSVFGEYIIIGTTKGVYKYNPLNKELFLISKLENVYARYIKKINSNSFWVGCYGDGLYLVKNNKTYKVNDKNINLNTAHAIEEDKFGNLWITTNDGLLTIDKKKLIINTLNGKAVEFYRFSVDDGLLTNEFNGGSTHPSFQTQDGIIGFPSMKGFVWFNPKQLNKNIFKGNILIDQVIIDNKSKIALHNNQYYIPKESNIVTINFSYGYYYNRENLTICYRFEDQKNWTIIKGNSLQIGRYNKGKQKLLIKIATHGFNESEAVTKSLILNYESRYYELGLFWIAIATLLILLFYISYFIGKYFQRKKEIELQDKINEKTLILNETVLELEISKNSILDSLNEKEILLKEIHHRVKNNLQIIMSLLNLQANNCEQINIIDFVENLQSRISSMSLIHQNLYENDKLDRIDFNEYIFNLYHNLIDIYGVKQQNIRVEINADNIYLNIQTAIPLGLILNELLTNTFKYAFEDFDNSLISIQLEQKQENLFCLTFTDNGIGFDEFNNNKSMGLELVKLLILQLRGTIEKVNQPGTCYKLIFKNVTY
jgi:two-component sensor histidine kinase